MKTELIQLAKEKEFKSELLSSEPMKYSHKEDTKYYLWMCELQRWLRDIYNIHVTCCYERSRDEELIYYCEIIHNSSLFSWDLGNSYNTLLENGLLEALKLINNE